MVGNAKVAVADMEAENGVLHVINTVLLPPASVVEEVVEAPLPATVVDVAFGSPVHFTLITAIFKAKLVGTLSSDGPFTVFAPTDAAFAAALDAMNMRAADLLARPDLSTILQYHVVPIKALSAD
eukprot:scaffold262737_cov41-Prasinocladus_malaysianus.AAC.2